MPFTNYIIGGLAIASLTGLSAAGYQSWRAGNLKDKNVALQADLSAAEGIIAMQGNTITTLSNRDTRRIGAAVEQGNIAKDINDAPNSTNCAASEPVRAVLNGLSNRSERAPATDNPE